MKRKKFWIVFSICCASVILLCTVLSLVFRVQTVEVEFRSRVAQASTNLPSGIKKTVLETGDFSYGKNILFYNPEKNIEKIEKEHPFVKVEQVVRYFPSTLRLYISERTPRYRVQDDDDADRWYILDKDFKVLDKVTTSEIKDKVVCGKSSYYNKTIEISPESFKISSHIGEFVSSKNNKQNLLAVTQGIYGRTQDIAVVKSISFSSNNKFVLTIKNSADENDNGCRIEVNGTKDLKQRVFAGIDLYMDTFEADSTVDLSNAIITVDISPDDDGKFIARFQD